VRLIGIHSVTETTPRNRSRICRTICDVVGNLVDWTRVPGVLGERSEARQPLLLIWGVQRNSLGTPTCLEITVSAPSYIQFP
jgi:hypothetical protein